MMTFRRVLGGLCVAACLGAQSCRQEAAEPTAKQASVKETVYKEGNIELPLYADLGVDLSEETNQLKALDATVGTQKDARGRLSVGYGNKFPVVCIIRSNQNDPITYIDDVEAVKQPDGLYKLNKERVHLAEGSALAAGKKWYMMVVTKNSFNKNNGELSVNANGDPETLTAGATRVMDIPAASAWIELPTFANGQPKWPKNWTEARRQAKLTLYPQGVLCRATLRLDDEYKAKLGTGSVELKVTQLKVVSSTLSFSGKFKFDKASLPPLSQTSGRPTIAWEATQTASAAREYRSLDANTPEYQKVFNAPAGGAVLQVSGSGSTAALFSDSNSPTKVENVALKAGVQSILFWAVPVTKGVSRRYTTLIAETGSTSSPDKVLQPSHTYIYGKQTKYANPGSAVSFDAVYYNPYTPLDYMAEYNVARKDPQEFRDGGVIPLGTSNEFATDHGVNSFAMLHGWAFRSVNILGADGRRYSDPTIQQWESVIPTQGRAAVNLISGDKEVNGVSLVVNLGGKRSKTTFSSRRVGNVVYALALTDFGYSQKYRVAYRYSMVDNPDAPTTPQPSFVFDKILMPEDLRKLLHAFRPDSTFHVSGYSLPIRKSFQVEAIHLGAGFSGWVEDVAREDFWSQRNARKEKRILPMQTNAWTAYPTPSDVPNFNDFYRIQKYMWEHSLKIYMFSTVASNIGIPLSEWGQPISSGANGSTLYGIAPSNNLYQKDAVIGCSDAARWTLSPLKSFLINEARYSCRPFTSQSR